MKLKKMKSSLEKLFIERDILEKEIEEDIISYRKRCAKGYSFKEASKRHSKWNYIIFRQDFKKYLQDNNLIHLEKPLISLNSNF